MATDFTPGPWKIFRASNGSMLGFGVDRPNDEDHAAGVTDAYGGLWGSGGEKEANAHLIAAAPEMYEALLLSHDIVQMHGTIAFAVLTNALAKARGEQVSA